MGTLPVSHDGARYVVTYKDIYCDYDVAHFLARKHEQAPTYQNFKAFLTTQTGKSIKQFHSDRGGEYHDEKFLAHNLFGTSAVGDFTLTANSFYTRRTSPFIKYTPNEVTARRRT